MYGSLAATLAVFALAFGVYHLGSDTLAEAANDQVEQGDICALFDHAHDDWTALLGRYVTDGRVDYAGIARDGQEDLTTYLAALESVCLGHYEQWTRNEQLAYWINAYNAYTVRLILDNYPLASIRSIGFLPYAAFRKSFIPLKAVDRGLLSLNDIEHEILRPQFGEPRIHFAIVCASRGCPALRSEAYRAEELDGQLEDAARGFIGDARKNRYHPTSRTLELSAIFKWFREDFEAAAETLPDYFALYADDATATIVRADDVRVEFLDYDWSLNGS